MKKLALGITFSLVVFALFLPASVLGVVSPDPSGGGGDGGSNGLGRVFEPIADVLGGLFGILGGKNVMLWIRVILAFVITIILFLASKVVPAFGENNRARAAIAVALAIGTVIILKEKVLATILSAYTMLGLAILIGFTAFGVAYLCYKQIWANPTLANSGRIGEALRWFIPALIVAAFIGLVANIDSLLVEGLVVESIERADAPSWLLSLIDLLVAGGQIALIVFVIGAFIALLGASGRGAAAAVKMGFGIKGLSDAEKRELEKVVNNLINRLGALAATAATISNQRGFASFKKNLRSFYNVYYAKKIRKLKNKGIDVRSIEANVNAAAAAVHNAANWSNIRGTFNADVIQKLDGALADLRNIRIT